MNYPDIPSAESWMPNYHEAWNRGTAFAELLRSAPGPDLDQVITAYLTDLQTIFNVTQP